MKIGIIVHSHTGNTLSVGKRLQEVLTSSGHIAIIEQVKAMNEDPNSRESIKLKSIPAIDQYEAIIVGAPVRGFSLSPVMKLYLEQLPLLQGKRIACFITEYFPKPWMGGNRALRQMEGAIVSKGGKVSDKGIVNWSAKQREEQIADVVSRLAGI